MVVLCQIWPTPVAISCPHTGWGTPVVHAASHREVALEGIGWRSSCSMKVGGCCSCTSKSLPPACPELNAAENIWQYLRQTYLSNRVFKSYTDILDACQEAWQKLLDETRRSASIATRDWAIIGQSM